MLPPNASAGPWVPRRTRTAHRTRRAGSWRRGGARASSAPIVSSFPEGVPFQPLSATCVGAFGLTDPIQARGP